MGDPPRGMNGRLFFVHHHIMWSTQWHDPRFDLAGVVGASVLAKRLAKKTKKAMKEKQRKEEQEKEEEAEEGTTLREQLLDHEERRQSLVAGRAKW